MKFTFKRAGVKVLIGSILLKKEESGQSDETSGFARRLLILERLLVLKMCTLIWGGVS